MDGEECARRNEEAAIELLRAHGTDAVSFQTLENGMRHWFDEDESGAHAFVGYVDTGSAWVAAGGPICGAQHVANAARKFCEAAARAGRRACFFASERDFGSGFQKLLIGEQPIFYGGSWRNSVAKHRRLREQLRRARVKRVVTRLVHARELGSGLALRRELEELARQWLAARPMAPMGFVVSLQPFVEPSLHRYFIAEKDGRVIAFLSAIPIFSRPGWLVCDVVRATDAPNGTTETLLNAFMQSVADEDCVTLGLAPLSGPVPPSLAFIRTVTSPLYSFAGLRAFRARMRPHLWEPVWLIAPKSQGIVSSTLDALRAFAGGPFLRYGIQTVRRHPGIAPLALGLPLAPWTMLLAWLAIAGHAGVVGFSAHELLLWTCFDLLLCVALLRCSTRPTSFWLTGAGVAAAADALLSCGHIARVGMGSSLDAITLRALCAAAPIIGATVLLFAARNLPRRFTTQSPP